MLGSCQALWEQLFEHWEPQIHELHHRLYQTSSYDAEKMRDSYIRHHQEVQEYFQDRPEDLLVMRVGTDSWGDLCRFLDRDVPAGPFPHSNKRGAIKSDKSTQPMHCVNS